jgi:hypothetical protein
MSATAKVSPSIQSVAPESFRDLNQANQEDTLARARKLMAEAVGMDSHIDTIQRVLRLAATLGDGRQSDAGGSWQPVC